MIGKCIKPLTKSNLVAEENKCYDVGYSVNESLYNVFIDKDLVARLTDEEFKEHFQVISYVRILKKLEKYGDYYYNPNSLLLCQ